MRVIVFSLVLLITACQPDIDTPVDHFELEKPDYFPSTTYNEEKYPITRQGFELGKKLFNDPILSRDNSIACRSCHVQSFAFADPHTLSVGVDDKIGIRNAPPLQNLAYMEHFFWDGGVTHIDFTSLNAIENPLEMDENMGHVVEKLQGSSAYVKAFEEVYSAEINAPLVLKALAQFVAKLESTNSKYDAYLLGDYVFTALEEKGFERFTANCATCHSGALLTDQKFHNNGLDSIFEDKGFGGISENPMDDGTFRTPSLRNITHTAPYMHDGRFKTLDEVLEHYNKGVVESATLSPLLQKNEKLGLPLDAQEKEAIKAFLKTLTDYSFIQNEIFR